MLYLGKINRKFTTVTRGAREHNTLHVRLASREHQTGCRRPAKWWSPKAWAKHLCFPLKMGKLQHPQGCVNLSKVTSCLLGPTPPLLQH